MGTNKQSVRSASTPVSYQRQTGYWVQEGIKIHLYDMVSPHQQYTASQFRKDALMLVNRLWRKGKLPLVVGGTGFYIRILLGEVKMAGVEAWPKLRRELTLNTVAELQKLLEILNPGKFNKLNNSERYNPHRLIRAIEIELSKDRASPLTSAEKPMTKEYLPCQTQTLKIGLTAPRAHLYQKTDQWVKAIVEHGLIEETKMLMRKGFRETSLLRGLIYQPTVGYLDGQISSRQKLIARIQYQLHAYIRRQLAYFKKMPNVNWLDAQRPNFDNRALKLVESFLRKQTNARSSS